ncbi:MAG: hypothetical protein AAGA91_16745 [Pseudomonadota bacterium]
MNNLLATWRRVGAAALVCLVSQTAIADGVVGEHVNDLQGHLDEYSEEVVWMIGQVDGLVGTYDKGGLKAVQPDEVIDYWEAVDFHSAIETNYVPLYASIWQGLFGVKTAMDESKPVAEVRAEQVKLEQALWQSLGAVKLAAQYQEEGLLRTVDNTEAGTPVEELTITQRELDRVVAKYAEKLSDEAVKIVQETYLTRFEGVEGALIEQDAQLVEDLEIDFNVILPKAIQDGASVDDVRAIVVDMQAKLDRAKDLLEDADQQRSDVF